MATLTLKINVVDCCVTKTMNFDPSTIVYDACRMIRDKVPETGSGLHANASDYGLFYTEENKKTGIWLESARSLDYYVLRNGDLLEYKKKLRVLKVKMLDESVKTLFVDDSHSVAQIMITICSKIGITNHDEYSLVRELSEEEKEKTMTMKRDKSIARNQKKMDELKKRLHTDDELDWLDHSKSLREQGIEEAETLILRRKYFFSDQNIDSRDPIQLNLLYVQTRDAILKGTHPVTQDMAVEFAAMQCQIQFGDYIETKHKPGFLDLKEFLLKEYCRVKGIEKKIFQDQKKYAGLSEIDGKAKYTQLARSLPTYGIAFFLVKEKMKGRNKLVPSLLGITKESVVKVDEKKEIVKTWPLTTVKRWAASPNTFTLDFGDYSDSYYCVQTLEGEQIAQLISGYIDIILKKKQSRDHLGIDGEEESTMYEDSVSPAKATIIQHQTGGIGQASLGNVALPAVLRTGEMSNGVMGGGMVQNTQYSKMSQMSHLGHRLPLGQNADTIGLSHGQRALLGRINEGIQALSGARTNLQNKADLPNLGSDLSSRRWRESAKDLSKQRVGAELSAMNAATAQMVLLTSGHPDDNDYPAVGSAVQTISSNMGNFEKDVRMLAALEEDDRDGEHLMDAARRLVGAFHDMLIVAQPGSTEPRQNMLNAASRVGEASEGVMIRVEPGDDNDFKERLMAAARSVATATAAMVMQAKNVSARCQTKEEQNAVIETATQCALASSQLVACTRVLASTIDNAQCQDQLVDAAKIVAKSVTGVVDVSQEVCKDESSLDGLNQSADAVTRTLEDLMNLVKSGNQHTEGIDQVDMIMITTDRLCNSIDNTQELVKQARQLAQATSFLVNSLKVEADYQSDSDKHNRLLSAAKLLADATARMVEAAKGCATSPHDEAQQRALKNAADDLRHATSHAAANALKNQILHNLQQAAKNAASAATQLINASNGAGEWNSSQQSQQQLSGQCGVVSDEAIPKLVQALRASQKQQDNPSSLLQLVNASQDFIHPCNKLLSATKASLPTISDELWALSLNNASKNLTSALTELRSATVRAQQTCCTAPEADGTLDQIKALEQELLETKKAVLQGRLLPLPGETVELSNSQLGAASKAVATAMAQLLTAATQGNQDYTGSSAREVGNSLKNLAASVRGVAATTGDKELKTVVIDQGIDVVQKSGRLVEEAQAVVDKPEDVDAKNRLAVATKVVSQSLSSCVNILPGVKEVEFASKRVNDIGAKLGRLPQSPFRGTERSVAEIQLKITENAADFNKVTRDMLEVCQGNNTASIATTSDKLAKVYEDFVDGGVAMASQTKDPESKNQIVGGLRNVSLATSRFLAATKSMLTDPTGPSTKNLLTQAARAVTESINQLISVCTVSAPGQKECDSAHRQMQMLKPLLDNPCQPVTDGAFFDCLDNVIRESEGLANSMTSITSLARQSDMSGFCSSVDGFSKHVCSMIENAAQAAYLVGISDPSSEPGKLGIIDQNQFISASETIRSACATLGNPATSQEEMLSAVSSIATQTSLLCNACKNASKKTTNPVAKGQFVQSAKDLANNTALMVKSMKAATTNQSGHSPPINLVGHEASKPLLQSLEELVNFSLVPEFVNTPAKISQQGREGQRPILESGREIVEGACNMVLAAKQLAVKAKDANIYQAYSAHSHTLSEAIKEMVASLRSALPGHKECDTSLDQIGLAIHDLDQASLAVVSNESSAATLGDGRSLEMCHDQVLNSAWQLHDLVEPIQSAAKGETENLGHLTSSAAAYIGPLKAGTIGCVSKIVNSKVQTDLLDQCKTVMESLQGLIHAARDAGGNRKAIKYHQEVDDAALGAKESINELIETFERTASSSGVVSTLLDNLNKSLALSDVEVKNSPEESLFVDCQTNIARIVKQLAKTSNEMMSKSVTNVQDLGPLANDLTRDFADLAVEGQRAYISSPSPQMATRIRSSIQQLGKCCIGLVQNAGKVQLNPNDSFAKKDLTDESKKVIENATNILTILQSSARGTQACINAASTINGILADLDTTIMFASAGTLTAEPGETFSNYREGILKTAKELVEDTKLLVSGAALNQDQLAGAASKSVSTINQLSECIKKGAASLGNEQPDAQILLMNAVKDVTTALSDLIGATKSAAGKQTNDPAMVTLKDAAKVMVTNVTSLLKTVKTVEDEAARGTQALESSIQIIGQELKTYHSVDRMEKNVTPDEIIQATRQITMATSKAVAAGNSGHQDDVIAAANIGRKATSDLLKHCKGGVVSVEDVQLKQRMLDAGSACAAAYRELLLNIQQIIQKPSPELKLNLATVSKKVAYSVTEIVHVAEAIKGVDWVDPHDPTVIAENELLSAANSIEAAAKKLASLQPMLKPKQADETLNFEEQLLEAAKSIAAATGALVKAASVAQRELVHQGKIGVRDDPDSDSQWSQGLISAARLVAAATHSLCDAANAMVQGQASEEKLISSAKQVAASTAQLLLACKVKADPNSQAMHRLQNAGHAVKKATEALVKEAQTMKGQVEEDAPLPVTKKMVSDMAQIIMAQEEILRKERELEMARKKLETIRKAKYRPSEDE